MDSGWVSLSLPVTLKYMGMEGKTTWTMVLDALQWLQDWLTDSYLSKMDVAVATKNLAKSVWSTCTEKKVDKGLKSRWMGSSASFPNLLPVSRAVEWLHEEIVGIGVWLCFICCPLQGGSNLQPAHDPINPNACPLNLNPWKLFCFDLGPGKIWHYQLDT